MYTAAIIAAPAPASNKPRRAYKPRIKLTWRACGPDLADRTGTAPTLPEGAVTITRHGPSNCYILSFRGAVRQRFPFNADDPLAPIAEAKKHAQAMIHQWEANYQVGRAADEAQRQQALLEAAAAKVRAEALRADLRALGCETYNAFAGVATLDDAAAAKLVADLRELAELRAERANREHEDSK
jgi:hypothetical protein